MGEVAAISVDPPSEGGKIASLIGNAFPILSDSRKSVTYSYGMNHQMGQEVLANMGYVIVDAQGNLRHRVVDPIFGRHADDILAKLRALAPAP